MVTLLFLKEVSFKLFREYFEILNVIFENFKSVNEKSQIQRNFIELFPYFQNIPLIQSFQIA